jgi:hypothetical protein
MTINLRLFSQIAQAVMHSPSLRTPNLKLGKQIFSSSGRSYVALQQNPNTGSHWAQLARQGSDVVQFRDGSGKYVAVSVNGRVTAY